MLTSTTLLRFAIGMLQKVITTIRVRGCFRLSSFEGAGKVHCSLTIDVDAGVRGSSRERPQRQTARRGQLASRTWRTRPRKKIPASECSSISGSGCPEVAPSVLHASAPRTSSEFQKAFDSFLGIA